MKKNVYIAVAGLIAMGASATVADAKWATYTPVVVSSEAVATVLGTPPVAANPAFTAKTGDGLAALAVGGSVKLIVGGGAKFTKAVPLVVTGTFAASVPNLAGVWVAGTPTEVSYGPSTATLTNNDILTFTLGTISKLDYTNATGTVTLDLVAFNAAGSEVGRAQLASIANKKSTISAKVASVVNSTLDVTTGYKKGVAALTATVAITNGLADVPAAPVTDYVVTLSGDFTGVKSITATQSGGNATAATLNGSDAAGSTTAKTGTQMGVQDQMVIDAAKKNATIRVTGLGEFATAATYTFTMAPDAATALTNRTFQVAVERLATTTNLALKAQLAATNTATWTRDGANFTTNSTGPLNSIKMSNMAATAAKLTITAYDAAGVAVTAVAAAAALPTTIAGSATIVVTGSQILAVYPTAVRVDFSAESSDLVVSNVKKDASGVTVQSYRSSTNGGAL